MTKHKVKLIIDEGTEEEYIREGYLCQIDTDKIDNTLRQMLSFEADLESMTSKKN
jgi:hypothetical protein